MQCLEHSLEYVKSGEKNSSYPVIIVAAGSSSRMKGVDKISYEINGISVIAHTILAFASNPRICEIVVVTNKEKLEVVSKLRDMLSLEKSYSVAEGGPSREESVYCGIKALIGKYDKVLIHDGARPCVSDKVIENVCNALDSSDSVACGVRMKDTVKVVNEDMQVTKTLLRDVLVGVQTPQGVSVEKFVQSATVNELSRFTDDTSVVEAVGAKTVIVEGDYRNIKITTSEDIVLAKVYLEE